MRARVKAKAKARARARVRARARARVRVRVGVRGAEIWSHSASLGSTPVGLCAHACSRKIEPSGAW